MALTAPTVAPEVRRALREATDAIEQDAAAIAADIAAAIHRDVPVFRDDPRTVADTRQGAHEIIRSFVRTVRRGEPLDASEPVLESLKTARALARSGNGVRHLLQMCHIGHGVFLAAWDTHLTALDLPPEAQLGAATEARRITFAWTDWFGQRLSDEYELERERLVRTGEVQRAQAIRAVLAGDVHDQDAMSRTLGYELGRYHTALVLWSPKEQGDPGAILDQAARDVATALGAARPLLLPISGSVTWAWVGTDASPSRAALDGLRVGGGVSLAVGDPAPGAGGFRASHRDADDACTVALLAERRPGTVIHYARVQVAAMLVDDLDRTRRFVRRRLGGLGVDDDHHARLRATLRVYLEESGSRQATADRLSIHANTVGNRIRACQEILGQDFGGHPGELHLALTLVQQLGGGVLA